MLSEDNKVLPMAKHIELITRFVPFDMNQKNLITKMTTRMQNIAVDESHYLETKEMIGKWEQYLIKLSLDLGVLVSFRTQFYRVQHPKYARMQLPLRSNPYGFAP